MILALRQNPPLAWGVGLLGAILVAALIGPLVVDAGLADVGAVRPRLAPSDEFWLGTDGQGRDNVREMTVGIMAVIVAALSWMIATRTIRAQTLSVRERGYVQIARLNGVSGVRLVFVEVLPNLLPFIAASFVMTVSQAMLATIGLEALGLGPQSDLTLGMIIYWAQYYSAIVRGMWWWWMPPIFLISMIFVGLMLTSVGLDSTVNKRLAR
jgi:peptide/nickel transport system permease protein